MWGKQTYESDQEAEFVFQFTYWFTQATKDLCDVPLVRLQAEYEAHYEAAYDEAIAAGEDPPTAHTHAMKQLGDPKQVRRQLKKHYLLTWEKRCLKKLVDPKTVLDKVFPILLLGYFLFLMTFLLLERGIHYKIILISHSCMLPIFLYFIYYRLKIQHVFNTDGIKSATQFMLRGITAWFICFYYFFIFMMYVMLRRPTSMFNLSLWGCLMLFILIAYIFIFNIYRKLSNSTPMKE